MEGTAGAVRSREQLCDMQALDKRSWPPVHLSHPECAQVSRRGCPSRITISNGVADECSDLMCTK
jgi:hypothetical protein